MKKVYVHPAIIVRDVNMSVYMHQISRAKTTAAPNTSNTFNDGFHDIDVSNDTGSEIWNNSGEFM